MNMQFRELAALYSFFFYDNVENQSKYPIKFAIFNEEVAKAFPGGKQITEEHWIVKIDDMDVAVIGVASETGTLAELVIKVKANSIVRQYLNRVNKVIDSMSLDNYPIRAILVSTKPKPEPQCKTAVGGMKWRDAND